MHRLKTVNTYSEDTIKQNRKFISSVICAIEYCGRQDIGLRGHREDGSILIMMIRTKEISENWLN